MITRLTIRMTLQIIIVIVEIIVIIVIGPKNTINDRNNNALAAINSVTHNQ